MKWVRLPPLTGGQGQKRGRRPRAGSALRGGASRQPRVGAPHVCERGGCESDGALRGPRRKPRSLPMLGCPRGWFFRVALTSAFLLRPEQRSRLLVARLAPRARSQAPGKCAASPLPPGLRGQPSARRPCPKPRLEGQHGLGRSPGRVLSPRRVHGASITDRARGSAAGSRLVLRLGGASPAPRSPGGS